MAFVLADSFEFHSVFVREWKFHMMDSGIVYKIDRASCIQAALELMEDMGVVFAEGETEALAFSDDHTLSSDLVQRLPSGSQRLVAYLTLQLQIVAWNQSRDAALMKYQHAYAVENDDGESSVCSEEDFQEEETWDYYPQAMLAHPFPPPPPPRPTGSSGPASFDSFAGTESAQSVP